MPPHLHPRSTATSTLFAGTLLASFIVVGIPHIFPCPVPRKGYADAQRNPKHDDDEAQNRAQKDEVGLKKSKRSTSTQSKSLQEEAELFQQLQREAEILDREARECPVPKPSGVIGRLLGFEDKEMSRSRSRGDEKT